MNDASRERLPDFFLVGAAKSGTTALAKRLDQHPGVYVCKPKEPNFFAFPPDSTPTCVGPVSSDRLHKKLLRYSVTSRSDYEALFAPAEPGQRRGDASVRYLYTADSAERIAAAVPDAKIVAILRDPVARMHSHYHMNVRNGLEPLPFAEALVAETQRIAAGWGWDWHYTAVGRYGEQLRRYAERFDSSRLLVLFHDELESDPDALWRRLCEFLEIDPGFRPDLEQRVFAGRTPRSRWLRRLVWEDNPIKSIARRVVPGALRKRVAERVNKANQTSVTPLSNAARAQLRERFDEDAALLSDLLGRRPPW